MVESYLATRGWQNPTLNQPQPNAQERKVNNQSQPDNQIHVGGGFAKVINPGGSPDYVGGGNTAGNLATINANGGVGTQANQYNTQTKYNPNKDLKG